MRTKVLRFHLVLVLLFVTTIAACGGGGGGNGGVVNESGKLDTTFGTGGIVTTATGTDYDEAYAMVIQADGKMLVSGETVIAGNFQFTVVRYNTDGSLDTSFGTSGKVITAIGIGSGANGMAIQADGKIVVVGSTYDAITRYDFAVVRYNSNGSLDTSFGTGGKVTTTIGTQDESAYAVAIQGDGKIVVAGYAYIGSTNDFAVVRYNTNGTLDTSFSTDGKATISISNHDSANAIAIQGDGKILLAGESYDGSATNNYFAVVRYNTNGTVDTSFGTSGVVTTAAGISTLFEAATGLAIQTDGKIVASGWASNGTNYDFAVVRYNTDGTLDTSFNTTGKVITAIGSGHDYASGMKIQADGKILVVGDSAIGTKKSFALARYNPNGSLDSTFGTNGKVIQAIGTGNDVATAVALVGISKIAVAGYSSNGTDNDFAVAQFLM